MTALETVRQRLSELQGSLNLLDRDITDLELAIDRCVDTTDIDMDDFVDAKEEILNHAWYLRDEVEEAESILSDIEEAQDEEEGGVK